MIRFVRFNFKSEALKAMAKTEIKKSAKELSEKGENDETISQCKEIGRDYLGILKLNGWKTTLIIVLVSSTFGYHFIRLALRNIFIAKRAIIYRTQRNA